MTAHLNPRGDVAVLVPAAGSGVRLGPGTPKALRTVGGVPMLVHAVRRIAAAPSVGVIMVAAPRADLDAVGSLLAPVAPVTVVAGGRTRQESVAAALSAVPAHLAVVLVHDAARALAPPGLIERVAAAVRMGHDAVIPVLPVVDTVKRVAADGSVIGTVDRAALRVVQTPQGFGRALLIQAHQASVDALTDDAGLVEQLGVRVHCVPGDDLAFKITRPFDLAVAEAILNAR